MDAFKCGKCGKVLSNIQSFEKHANRVNKCDRIIKCEKCNRVFKTTQYLIAHMKRKTPCEPIVGNPTQPTPKNACKFCGRQLSTKQILENHYNTCKIKNGGMLILFEKVRQLEIENKKLNEKVNTLEHKTPNTKTINNNTNNTDASNHHNTNININLVNWDDNTEIIKKILAEHLPKLLAIPRLPDVSLVQQVSDRVVNLVGLVFRNPEYKELQGIYVVDLSKNKDNAFTYNDDRWEIASWDDLRTEMLQKLYMCKPKTKEAQDDVLNIIKYLFVLGKCGDCKSIERLSDDETLRIYGEISKQLKFNTMILES
jgi:uncharacterized C2H2 Zn-finger protein